MKKVLGIVAIAGLAATANAQFTGTGNFFFEVSKNGGTTWLANGGDVLPGATVKVRMRAQYNSTGGAVAGVSSVDVGEVQFNGANSSDGLSVSTIVDNLPNVTTNSTASDGKRGIFDITGGRKLDTTNTASTNPLSSSNRLKWGQLSNLLVAGLPVNPDYKGGSPVTIFTIDIVAGTAGPGGRTVTIDTIVARASAGYLGLTGTQVGLSVHPGTPVAGGPSLVATPLTDAQLAANGTAQFRIVPTPASLALLGLGGLAAGRRRR